jgi:hypothetical protein
MFESAWYLKSTWTQGVLETNKQYFRFNRNKPKLTLFWLFFDLSHETKKNIFRFVSVIRTFTETTETNKPVSKQTETNRNNSTLPLHLQVQRRLMDTSRCCTRSLVDKVIYRCSTLYCLISSNCKTNAPFFKNYSQLTFYQIFL